MKNKFIFLSLILTNLMTIPNGVDIHTGMSLKNTPPSTGLDYPQDAWVKEFIKALKENDYSAFNSLIKKALHANPGSLFSLFTRDELTNIICYHKLGDGKTIFDIANESTNFQIKEDIILLKILANQNLLESLSDIKNYFNNKK